MQIVERDVDGRTVGQTVGCIVEGLHRVKREMPVDPDGVAPTRAATP